MLLALKSLFNRGRIPSAQLALDFESPPAVLPAPRDAEELLARLRALGLKRIDSCRLTRNRNVMVSYRGSELRVHLGYLDAPAEIHAAIVSFVTGRTRAERRMAR